jgi:hypothetical protein
VDHCAGHAPTLAVVPEVREAMKLQTVQYMLDRFPQERLASAGGRFCSSVRPISLSQRRLHCGGPNEGGGSYDPWVLCKSLFVNEALMVEGPAVGRYRHLKPLDVLWAGFTGLLPTRPGRFELADARRRVPFSICLFDKVIAVQHRSRFGFVDEGPSRQA